MSRTVLSIIPAWLKQEPRFGPILSHRIRQRNLAGEEWPELTTRETGDVERNGTLPSPPEQADNLLAWLRTHEAGTVIELDERHHEPIAGSSNGEAFRMAVRDLKARDLIEAREEGRPHRVLVTTAGWRYGLPAGKARVSDPEPASGLELDVFLCHASEDKRAVVEPLRAALNEAGVSTWYDRDELVLGDNLLAKVQEGVRISRYVVVILSKHSSGKRWPEAELNAALGIETASGKVKVLPVLCGSEAERSEILERYPLVASKLHVAFEGGVEPVVDAIRKRLGRDLAAGSAEEPLRRSSGRSPLYMEVEILVRREQERLLRSAVQPWAFFNRGMSIKDFYGRDVTYSGIKFEGTPHDRFWNGFIEPFLDDVLVRCVDHTAGLASDRGVDLDRPLVEVEALLKGLIGSVYLRMQQIDQQLRGAGYPMSVEPQEVDSYRAAAERRLAGIVAGHKS